MIVINLVLFIGLLLLARDLQSLVGNVFNYFCVHGSLIKERDVWQNIYNRKNDVYYLSININSTKTMVGINFNY